MFLFGIPNYYSDVTLKFTVSAILKIFSYINNHVQFFWRLPVFTTVLKLHSRMSALSYLYMLSYPGNQGWIWNSLLSEKPDMAREGG